MLTLYRKNSMGIGLWCIMFDQGTGELRYGHAVVQGAQMVWHKETVELNNSGRNLDQQAELQMNARISRARDKGYKDSVAEAEAGATNQMGLVNPMLAQSLNKVNVKFTQAHVQPKLNGHRCLITNNDGTIFAYTRKGKPITTIPHILQDFSWLAEGRTVDGELYIHGRSLQSLSSLIKRSQTDSAKLRFHWYDVVNEKPFDLRIQAIEHAAFVKDMQHVDVVDTFKVSDMEQVYKLFHHFRSIGYEGAMLRLSIAGYEDGQRSVQLLKVKARDDCEVTVLGAEPSKDGWAVLQVRYDKSPVDDGKVCPKEGATFKVSAPGSVPQKQEILDNIDKYIGRRLRIEYAELTADGIPFHAVAMEWKEEL